jgi:hypothetical protein
MPTDKPGRNEATTTKSARSIRNSCFYCEFHTKVQGHDIMASRREIKHQQEAGKPMCFDAKANTKPTNLGTRGRGHSIGNKRKDEPPHLPPFLLHWRRMRRRQGAYTNQ